MANQTFPTFLILEDGTRAKSLGKGAYAFPLEAQVQAGASYKGDNGLNYVVSKIGAIKTVPVRIANKISSVNRKEVFVEKEKQDKDEPDDNLTDGYYLDL